MKNYLLIMCCISTLSLFADGFKDTSRNTKSWYDGNGSSYSQPMLNGYAASDPTPDCPSSGIYLKNDSPHQETFTIYFNDNAEQTLSILPNDTRCIHTTLSHRIESISVPFQKHTKTFRTFFKDTIFYEFTSANNICKTLSYMPTNAHPFECWQAMPNLSPLYTETPAIRIKK
jgi:hypothetical protein